MSARDAWEGLRTLETLRIDAVVFDTGVGDMPGDRFSRLVRKELQLRDLPILFLSGRASEPEVEQSLERTGLEKTLRKPLECSNLNKEIARLLGLDTNLVPRDVTIAGLSLDRNRFVLLGETGSTTLTPTEFRLLEYLMERHGDVIGREELLEKVWNFPPSMDKGDTVRSHMRNLRKKIRTVTDGRDVIRTLPGRGYQFAA